jgi:hypothetical protein
LFLFATAVAATAALATWRRARLGVLPLPITSKGLGRQLLPRQKGGGCYPASGAAK